jgi:tRNA(adenine34) deaminase
VSAACDTFFENMKGNTAAVASDERWMREALALAREAEQAGEVPVGALVVFNGEVIGHGFNRSIADSDPSAHAEIIALREAAGRVKNYRLEGCELFATIEPCAMCAGAMVHARISRLIYGAEDPKAGAVGSVLQVVNHPRLNHRIEVTGGVLAKECAELLQAFFRQRRA